MRKKEYSPGLSRWFTEVKIAIKNNLHQGIKGNGLQLLYIS